MKISVDTPHINIRVYNDSGATLYSYAATDIHIHADIEQILSAVQEMVGTKIAGLGSFGDTEHPTYTGRLYLYNAANTYVKTISDVTFHQAQKLMDEYPTYAGVYYPTPIDMRSSFGDTE